MIEILSHISGVSFNQAWERRIAEVIDDLTGLKAFVISADDLIANKLAAARPQDIADAAAVHRALKARDKHGLNPAQRQKE